MQPSPLEHLAPPSAPPGLAVPGALVAAWGIGGVLFLLARGTAGLLRSAGDAFGALSPAWALAIALLVVLPLGALKGRFVFERNLAPRVVGRAFHLARRRSFGHVLVAPLFCLGLVHATRKRRVVGWTMMALIAGFVAGTRMLAQPYRGVIAAAVALGLSWGAVALVVTGARAFGGRPPAVSLDLPDAG